MSDEGGLTGRLIPRRAAAKKASQLSAEQLQSSPVASDRDDRARTFGEPEKTRSPIKFTYGGKGRHRNSPKRSVDSAPQSAQQPRIRRPAASARARTRSAPSASTRTSNAHTRGVTPRSSLTPLTDFESEDEPLSPLRAKLSRNAVLHTSQPGSSLSPLSDSEPEAMPAGRSRAMRSRNGAAISQSITEPLQPRTATKSTLSSFTTPRFSGKKRALSSTSSERSYPELDDESVLTPLSSPGPSNSPTVRRSLSHSALNPGRRPRSPLGPTRSEHLLGAYQPSSRRRGRSDAAQSALGPHVGNVHPDGGWNLGNLGMHVWVRVDERGSVAEGDDTDSETLWWPAKVVHSRIPLEINLFGDSPRRAHDRENIIIHSPSPSNILPVASGGTLRFNETNFRRYRQSTPVHESPKKKQKSDLEARWRAARDLMLKADQDDNDGLPMLLSTYVDAESPSSSRVAARAGTARNLKPRVKQTLSEVGSPVKSRERVWRAPSCDPMYDLPGELVLAKEKKSLTQYWPARLLTYLKPENPKQKPKYEVEFFDGEILQLEPNLFYTTLDKGFNTCKLGQDVYNYGLNEENDEPDHELLDEVSRQNLEDESKHNETTLRLPSPLPCAPFPYRAKEKLSISEQFEYVKPVLAAVIEGEYEPAKQRHVDFMRGAAARRNVCESGYSRGSLRPREVEELLNLVMRWARRREKRKELDIPLGHGDPSHGKPATLSQDICADANSQTLPAEDKSGALTPMPATDPERAAPSSEAEPPPSSSAAGMETDEDLMPPEVFTSSDVAVQIFDSQIAGPEHGTTEEQADRPDRPFPIEPPDVKEDVDMVDTSSSLQDNNKVSADSSEQPRPRLTFTDLAEVDKITYCQNILLNEAVLQLLLWRSGQRTSVELLSTDEEHRLHEIALAEADKTYWVHDIIRMKQTATGNLSNGTADRKTTGRITSSQQGGTRSRPRRG